MQPENPSNNAKSSNKIQEINTCCYKWFPTNFYRNTSYNFNHGYCILNVSYGNENSKLEDTRTSSSKYKSRTQHDDIFVIDVDGTVHKYQNSCSTPWWKQLTANTDYQLAVETIVTGNEYKNSIFDTHLKINVIKMNDTEAKILHQILNIGYYLSKTQKSTQSVQINLFTYMDMCPSCWTLWEKQYSELTKLFGCQNICVNVYSMKPYLFTVHPFVQNLKQLTQYNKNKGDFMNSLVHVDDFDSKDNTCMRRNICNSNINNNQTTHIKQYVDVNNIRSLKKFVKKLEDKQQLKKLTQTIQLAYSESQLFHSSSNAYSENLESIFLTF